ncbi:MAG: cell division protein ZapA [Bryobacteraceae bacterium]
MNSGAAKKTVRVTIFGQPYVLRAPADPGEVEALAAEVDRLMDSVAAKTGDADPARVAVLVCLHLADRLRSVERELSELRRRIEEKTEQLSLLLE